MKTVNKKQAGILTGLIVLLLIGAFAVMGYFVRSTGTQTATTTPITTATLSESKPVRLSIPKIGVDAGFVPLGLDENKEIEVPESYTEVGWYTYGPTPGEMGPSIVIGHVDSKTGPAVLYSLGKLAPGDRFTVTREDGSLALFEVDKLERYYQKDFPTQLVYGDIDHAGIRLITCSGEYDREAQRYDKNLVVYGHLVKE